MGQHYSQQRSHESTQYQIFAPSLPADKATAPFVVPVSSPLTPATIKAYCTNSMADSLAYFASISKYNLLLTSYSKLFISDSRFINNSNFVRDRSNQFRNCYFTLATLILLVHQGGKLSRTRLHIASLSYE